MNNIVIKDSRIEEGDARDLIKTLEPRSVDAIITDPPYPGIKRDYGCYAEDAWLVMMGELCAEFRRVLKPSGSALIILQPNSNQVGRMRHWPWKFITECQASWNVIQDIYWWNPAAMPSVHCQRKHGLMRPSVKLCVWLGEPDCYRCQDNVLWEPSDALKAKNREDHALIKSPSGYTRRDGRIVQTVEARGGVTPFNLIPISNTDSKNSGGAKGHGAATPYKLCEWFVRYLCPVGGTVLDPFCGSGTVGRAARAHGCNFIGFEKDPQHFKLSLRELGGLQHA